MGQEPDQLQLATLIGGLPTCVFAPRSYHRKITNIVVTNGTTSIVNCYRGSLTSSPVATNSLGSRNTISGQITVPAGQVFYVQWSAAGSPVSSATARVSFTTSPFDDGGSDSQEWATNAVGSITVPTNAGPGEARMVIGSELPPPLDTYQFYGTGNRADSGIVFYQVTPTDDDYNFLVHVRAASQSVITIGHVLGGSVLEKAAGFPAGQAWTFAGSGLVNNDMDISSGGDWQINGISQGRGLLGYARQNTTITTVGAAEAVVQTLGGLTYPYGRAFAVKAVGSAWSGSVVNTATLRVRRTNLAGVELVGTAITPVLAVATQANYDYAWVFCNDTAGDITTSIVLTVQPSAGNVIQTPLGAHGILSFEVWDIGRAADFFDYSSLV